jgi:alpha-tubulin suppressor-like RCC1 family protein
VAADAEAALANAARRGTARQVKAACALVHATPGADIDRRSGRGQVTALHLAAWRGDARVVRVLCDAGASVTARDGESGWSPLHRAFHHGNARAAAALLARGAALHQPIDDDRRSPLDILTRALRRRFDDDALDRDVDGVPLNQPASSSASPACDLYSWGSGVNFQLGTGAVSEQPTPRRVDDVAVAVPTAGDDTNTKDANANDDTNTNDDASHKRGTKEPCGGVLTASAGKFHSVCATHDGAVYAWGHGRGGRLGLSIQSVFAGDEAVVRPTKLREFGNSLRAVSVAAGKHHTLVATRCGGVFAWGVSRDGCLGYLVGGEEGNNGTDSTRWGQSGSSPDRVSSTTSEDRFVPTPRRVGGALKGIRIVAVAASNRHSAVLSDAGDAYTFGSNAKGQLGISLGSTHQHTHQPRRVDLSGKDLSRKACVGIACAKAHTVALTADDGVFQWGHGSWSPRRVDLVSGLVRRDEVFTLHQGVTSKTCRGGGCVVAVAAGAATSLALTSDGAVLRWRSDDPGLRTSLVDDIPGECVSIAAGKTRCAAVTAFGDVYAWDGVSPDTDSPFRVDGIKRCIGVFVGEKHSLALQRIAKPPRDKILTLGAEKDEETTAPKSPLDRSFESIDTGSVDEVTARLDAMYSTAADVTCADDSWEDIAASDSSNSDTDSDSDSDRRPRVSPCPSLKDLCVLSVATSVCDVRNASDLASFAAHLDAPSLRLYALRVAASNLDAALGECGPAALVECDPAVLAAMEALIKRGCGATFTGPPTRDVYATVDDTDANEEDTEDSPEDDDEAVFRERRDAAEFLARIRAVRPIEPDDAKTVIDRTSGNTEKGTKPRRGRGRGAGVAGLPPTPPRLANETNNSGPSWLTAPVRGVVSPDVQPEQHNTPVKMRGAGTSRRAAEAAASRAARGALSLFLSGALEEGFHRGGGDDNVAFAAAEIAQRNATPKTWNTGPSRTDASMNMQSDISTDAPGDDDTGSGRKSGSGQRGLPDIQLAQEREAAEAALAARGWAATASRSVPGGRPESLPSRSQSVDTNSNVNVFSTSGGGSSFGTSPNGARQFSLGALIGKKGAGYGGRGVARRSNAEPPPPPAWGGLAGSIKPLSRGSTPTTTINNSPCTNGSPSLLDIQAEEEARSLAMSVSPGGVGSPFGSFSERVNRGEGHKRRSQNFINSHLGASPGGTMTSWYVPDSGRTPSVGLRARMSEEEDARLARTLADEEAERVKVKAPKDAKTKNKPKKPTKPDPKKGGEKVTGDQDKGRRRSRASTKPAPKGEPKDVQKEPKDVQKEPKDVQKEPKEVQKGRRRSKPAKASTADVTGDETKQSESKRRGNGRGARGRAKAPAEGASKSKGGGQEQQQR